MGSLQCERSGYCDGPCVVTRGLSTHTHQFLWPVLPGMELTLSIFSLKTTIFCQLPSSNLQKFTLPWMLQFIYPNFLKAWYIGLFCHIQALPVVPGVMTLETNLKEPFLRAWQGWTVPETGNLTLRRQPELLKFSFLCTQTYLPLKSLRKLAFPTSPSNQTGHALWITCIMCLSANPQYNPIKKPGRGIKKG